MLEAFSIDELKLKAGQSPAILSANILLLIVSTFRSFLNFMLIQTAIQSKLVIFVAVPTQCLKREPRLKQTCLHQACDDSAGDNNNNDINTSKPVSPVSWGIDLRVAAKESKGLRV